MTPTHEKDIGMTLQHWFKMLSSDADRWLASLVMLFLPMAVSASPPSSTSDNTSAAVVLGKTSKAVKIRPVTTDKSKSSRVSVQVQESPLSAAELAIAQRIETGSVPCELGAVVTVKADTNAPGYFDLQLNKLKFRMVPVETSTGAIRLEDRNAGAVWLQLSNKSMLMNQKLGQRLADACMSAAQVTVAAALEKTPLPSLLDALPAPVLVAQGQSAGSPAVPKLSEDAQVATK
jgi:hypothetical protein